MFVVLPRHTHLAQHHIDTKRKGQGEPLAPAKEDVGGSPLGTADHVEVGVVKESHSEWRSPIMMVLMSDGSICFCFNFQSMNAISKYNVHSRAQADGLLDRLGAAKYISSLNLTKDYWLIALTVKSQEKTAFFTLLGLYQFKTVTSGLHGAVVTFQYLMDQVLCSHGKYAAANIDNIVIYSQDWNNHLRHMTAILQAL